MVKIIPGITLWEDISEYVVLDGSGNLYSLANSANDSIKTMLIGGVIYSLNTATRPYGLVLKYTNPIFRLSAIQTKSIGPLNNLTDGTKIINIPIGYNPISWKSLSYTDQTGKVYLPLSNSITTVDIALINQDNKDTILYLATMDQQMKNITEVFLLLKKKDKISFNELQYNTYTQFADLPNQEFNYKNNKYDKQVLNKYCCDGKNFVLPECSPVYLNDRNINGVLNYDISYKKDGQTVYLQNGKINNPIDMLTFVQLPGDTNIIYLYGTLNIPVTDTYVFKFTTDSSTRVKIDDKIILDSFRAGKYFTNETVYTAGKHKFEVLYKMSSNSSLDMQYTNSKMINSKIVPKEWFSAIYYYDINTNMNNALISSCNTPTDWFTSRCFPYVTTNSILLKASSKNIIDKCNINSPDLNSAECKMVYNSIISNYDINKSYCSEDNRFINNPNCLQIANNNQTDFKQMQIDYCLKDNNFMNDSTCIAIAAENTQIFKPKQIDYCTASQSNWMSKQCQQLVNSDGTYANDFDFYDKYCITNKNANTDYINCKSYYGEDLTTANGKKFTDTLINICTTPDSKLFSNTLCTNIGPHPAYLDSAINTKKINLCKSDVTNPLCINEIKNYDIYGNDINNYCSTNKFQNITNPICDQILNSDDPTLSPVGGKLTDSTIQKQLYNTKLNYCNQSNTFTTDSCKSWILKNNNINEYDLLLKNNCSTDINKSIEPCQTINNPLFSNLQAIPQFGFNKTMQCIDTNGKLIQNDDCSARNIQSNSYYTNLIEPTMKYCKDDITNESCTKYMNDLTNSAKQNCTQVKSAFEDNENKQNDSNNWIQIFGIFVFILLCIIIFGKFTSLDYILLQMML